MRHKLGLIGLSLLLAGCDPSIDLNSAQQIAAETGARRTLAHFETCSGRDSDGDGYVTCSGRETKEGPVVTLLCSYKNNAIGCKRK
jgi:hypothetical protein